MSKPVATFMFDRGETISIALEVSSGDAALVQSVTARLVAVPWGKDEPDPGASAIDVFAVTPYPAVGNTPAGFLLTIPAQNTAAMSPGMYQTDARVVVAGGTIVTDRVAIQLLPSISG